MGSARDDSSVASENAHPVGVYGHAAQAKASRTDRASREPPADGMRDVDDTGDVLASVSGRSVMSSVHVGQVYASVSPRAWTCQSPSTGLS